MSAAEILDHLVLRETRTTKALSVRGLARLSGVSPRTIRRIEAGHCSTRNMLEKLERALEADERHLAAARLGIEPGSRDQLRDVVPWEVDPCAQYAVACHPDGLSAEEVAELLGLSRRTVDMVEQVAHAKLRVVLEEEGGRWTNSILIVAADRSAPPSARRRFPFGSQRP